VSVLKFTVRGRRTLPSSFCGAEIQALREDYLCGTTGSSGWLAPLRSSLLSARAASQSCSPVRPRQVREDLEQNFIWEFFYHTLLKWAVLHRPGSLVFIFIYRIKSGTILIKRRDNANSTYFSGYRPLPTELLRETGRERE